MHCTNKCGNALHAACYGDDIALEAIDYLIKEVKVSVTEVNENGDTPLHLAAISGSVNSLLVILSYILPPNNYD